MMGHKAPKHKRIMIDLKKLRQENRDGRLLTQTLMSLANDCQIRRLNHYMQHGQTSCMEHSFAVAYYSMVLANRFRIRCNRKSLVVGALLHDYFLYDWHQKQHGKLHGFFHPGIALQNAKRDLSITTRESDIIKKHMFPLTMVPPKYREGFLVCLADKYCTLLEVFHKRPYERILQGYGEMDSFKKLYDASEGWAEELQVQQRIAELPQYVKEECHADGSASA